NLNPLAQFWRRLNATLIPELRRLPADHFAHRRARHRQRPNDLLDRQMPLEKSASYLSDLVHADHPHKPLPADTGQQKGTLTKRQRGSRLDAKNTPQGDIIASEFTHKVRTLRLEHVPNRAVSTFGVRLGLGIGDTPFQQPGIHLSVGRKAQSRLEESLAHHVDLVLDLTL